MAPPARGSIFASAGVEMRDDESECADGEVADAAVVSGAPVLGGMPGTAPPRGPGPLVAPGVTGVPGVAPWAPTTPAALELGVGVGAQLDMPDMPMLENMWPFMPMDMEEEAAAAAAASSVSRSRPLGCRPGQHVLGGELVLGVHPHVVHVGQERCREQTQLCVIIST